MINVCLSHDIDRTRKTYQFFTKSFSAILKGRLNVIKNQVLSLSERKPYWKFQDFIEIEQSYNIRSTVFFLNESIKIKPLKISSYKLALGRYNILDEKIVDKIKWLDKNGWEVGVHGSYNSFNNPALLLKEKQMLEKIVGHPIIGIRQHYLNLNENTWKYQKEVGFKYDSSWGDTNLIGYKDHRYLPFHPFNDNFIVIPIVIMDTVFFSTKNKWKEFEKLIEICESEGAIMVINFHQHVFNKYDYPGFKDVYIELINKLKSKNAVFYTLSELYENLVNK